MPDVFTSGSFFIHLSLPTEMILLLKIYVLTAPAGMGSMWLPRPTPLVQDESDLEVVLYLVNLYEKEGQTMISSDEINPELLWKDVFNRLFTAGARELAINRDDLEPELDTEEYFRGLSESLIVAIRSDENSKRCQEEVEMALKLIDVEGVKIKELQRNEQAIRSLLLVISKYGGRG